jgi:hypothetical protein
VLIVFVASALGVLQLLKGAVPSLAARLGLTLEETDEPFDHRRRRAHQPAGRELPLH